LEMTLYITPFDAPGRKRIVQLIAKSNQFNLTTVRYSEAEVSGLEQDKSAVTAQIRLTDTFGDNGMICVIVAHDNGDALEITEWLMSCRVLGRRVEEAVLDWLVKTARQRNKSRVVGRFVPTAKNMMVKGHYERLGFTLMSEHDGTSVWQLSVAGYQGRKPPIMISENSLRK